MFAKTNSHLLSPRHPLVIRCGPRSLHHFQDNPTITGEIFCERKFSFLKIIYIFTNSCPKTILMSSVCEEVTYQNIFKEHSKALRNFIYYKCGNLERAKDVMQEAMIRLWENC